MLSLQVCTRSPWKPASRLPGNPAASRCRQRRKSLRAKQQRKRTRNLLRTIAGPFLKRNWGSTASLRCERRRRSTVPRCSGQSLTQQAAKWRRKRKPGTRPRSGWEQRWTRGAEKGAAGHRPEWILKRHFSMVYRLSWTLGVCGATARLHKDQAHGSNSSFTKQVRWLLPPCSSICTWNPNHGLIIPYLTDRAHSMFPEPVSKVTSGDMAAILCNSMNKVGCKLPFDARLSDPTCSIGAINIWIIKKWPRPLTSLWFQVGHWKAQVLLNSFPFQCGNISNVHTENIVLLLCTVKTDYLCFQVCCIEFGGILVNSHVSQNMRL